ncbi:unnamed protein product [Blepharisma stoltei]|uniref:Uncharacterized protein n=1 Tax=Blepharisma stoltei TaxID=1481888 RepID=A0AAU9IJT3_9CILI|nr:unnamed protein product [Blepharisma stoltei]
MIEETFESTLVPDIDFLKYVYEEIEQGSEIERVYDQIEKPITLEKVKKILKELSIAFTYDFAQAHTYFQKKTNKNDPDDIIDPNNIRFESFKRRLGNYILEKAYDITGYEGGVAQLIEDTRHQPTEKFSIQESTKEGSFIDEDVPQTNQNEAALPKRESKNTWISKKLEEHKKEIEEVFNTNFNQLQGLMDIRVCKEIVQNIFEITKVDVAEKEIKKIFRYMDKQYPPKKCDENELLELRPEAIEELAKLGIDPSLVFPKISLDEILDIIETWAETSVEPIQDDNILKINKTIKEYTEICRLMAINDQNTKPIEILISNLEKELKDYKANKEKIAEKEVLGKQKDNLKGIFQFYSQVKMLGKSSTFEEIKDNQSVLTLPRFIQFCIDFNLIGIPSQQCRFISKDEVKIVFKRVSVSSRIMKESHFFDALDKLAAIFYNKKYDETYQTNFANQSLSVKRKLLYEYLGVNNTEELKKKGIIIKPKPKITDKKKDKRRSKSKAISKTPKSEIQKPIISIEAKEMTSSRRSLEEIPAENKKISLIKTNENEADHAKTEAQKILKPVQSTKVIKPPPLINLETTKITWNDLHNMDIKEINTEDSLTDLIYSEKQKQKLKNKNSSQKNIFQNMQEINEALKLHDTKLEKGLKIVEKAKASIALSRL